MREAKRAVLSEAGRGGAGPVACGPGWGEAGPLVRRVKRAGARERKEGVGRGFGWARKLGLGVWVFFFSFSFSNSNSY